jgi:hypothetical protein
VAPDGRRTSVEPTLLEVLAQLDDRILDEHRRLGR